MVIVSSTDWGGMSLNKNIEKGAFFMLDNQNYVDKRILYRILLC